MGAGRLQSRLGHTKLTHSFDEELSITSDGERAFSGRIKKLR